MITINTGSDKLKTAPNERFLNEDYIVEDMLFLEPMNPA